MPMHQVRFGVFKTAAVAVAVWAGCGLHAQALDLRQAYEAALVNDAQIKASRAATQAVRERVPQAMSQMLPNVSLGLGRNHNDLKSTSLNLLGQPATTDYNYISSNKTLSVRQPLYRPYLTAQLRQAQTQVDDGEASLERDEQSLVTRVAEAYFNALLANDQLGFVKAQIQATTAQLDAARKSFAAGSGTRTDIDEAQARLDLARAQELEAKQNVAFTARGLEVLIGEPLKDLAGLQTDKYAPATLDTESVDVWVERAEQNSPEIRSLRAQVEGARLEIKKASSGHLPTLDAVAQWSKSASENLTNIFSRYDNKSLGVQLSIPLYSGGYVNSSVRQAVATLERAEQALEATKLDLAIRVHREYRGVTEGALRVKALEQAVRSAEQAVISSTKSFAAGSRTTLDVLNAEQQRTSALRDLAQSRYVQLLSLLRLRSLVGDDREDNILAINAWLTN